MEWPPGEFKGCEIATQAGRRCPQSRIIPQFAECSSRGLTILVPTLCVETGADDALRRALPQSGHSVRFHAERGNEGF